MGSVPSGPFGGPPRGEPDPYGGPPSDPYGAGPSDPYAASAGGVGRAVAAEPRRVAAVVTAGAAGLALLLFLGSLTIWAQTSKSDLCAAYTKASGQVSSESTYYVDVDPLIEAAKHYPDDAVRHAGEQLDAMSSTFSQSAFYTAASAIGSECTGGSY